MMQPADFQSSSQVCSPAVFHWEKENTAKLPTEFGMFDTFNWEAHSRFRASGQLTPQDGDML